MATRPGTYSNPMQPAAATASGTTPVYPYYYPNAYPTQKPRSKKSHSKKRHSSKKHHHHRKEKEEERGVVRKIGHHLKEHKWAYLIGGSAVGAGYYMYQKRKEKESVREREEEGHYEVGSGDY